MMHILARIDRTQLIAVAAWIGLAVGVLVLGAPLAAFSRLGPGPGFFLKILSGILLLLALLQGLALIQRARLEAGPVSGAQEIGQASVGARGVLGSMAIIAALLAYAWLMPQLGFLLATVLLCWLTLTLLGRHPLRALVEAAIATVVVQFAFTTGLGVPLPEAKIGFLQALHF